LPAILVISNRMEQHDLRRIGIHCVTSLRLPASRDSGMGV
jgi:hypothetical protein